MENRKKIFIAAEIFPPDVGGPATYCLELAQGLRQRGYEVTVLCYGEKQNDAFAFSVIRVSRKYPLPLRYGKYFFYLWKMALKHDSIYAQGPIASGLPALLLHLIIKKKYIVKIVGDYAWERARNFNITDIGIDTFQKRKFPGKIGILQNLERLVCRHASHVIVPSHYLKTIVISWEIPEKNISVIYNALTFHAIENAQRDYNTIVSVGRLVPWKGFEALIEIMPDLLKENKNFRLMIYGTGPELEKLTALIHQLGVGNNVNILCMKRDAIIENMSRAGMFVLNSGYEGLSHTILEAMAAGIPVIASNVGGNPEIIETGKNGILLEYNNKEQLKEAILRVFREPRLREEFIKNTEETLKKFQFEVMMSKTIEILDQ